MTYSLKDRVVAIFKKHQTIPLNVVKKRDLEGNFIISIIKKPHKGLIIYSSSIVAGGLLV